LADEGALRVWPQVGRPGGRREAHLAVVARVLERLADDDADVLVAERRDPGRVLVPLGHELEEARSNPWFHGPDPDAVARRDEAVALGQELDEVARVHLGELARVGQLDEE